MYKLANMTPESARIIAGWKYPGEYAIYSFADNEATIAELMNGDYFACTTTQGKLIGYFCFGGSAQIPAERDYTRDAGKTDIGLGLSPELCGLGYGKDFMQSGILYAKHHFNSNGLRLVVAAFNKRAIALYTGCGFTAVDKVTHRNSKMEFIVMQCSL